MDTKKRRRKKKRERIQPYNTLTYTIALMRAENVGETIICRKIYSWETMKNKEKYTRKKTQ